MKYRETTIEVGSVWREKFGQKRRMTVIGKGDVMMGRSLHHPFKTILKVQIEGHPWTSEMDVQHLRFVAKAESSHV